MPAALNDVRLLDLPRHSRDDGDLVVAQALSQVPFAISRIFTLKAAAGSLRGKHAHRLCSQFMICVHGAIDIVCDDAKEQHRFILDRDNLALMVPPTIWNTVHFREAGSVLAVLCDRPYEDHDYIRDYPEFLAFRKASVP